MKFFAGACLWLGIMFLIRLVGLSIGIIFNMIHYVSFLELITCIIFGTLCWSFAFLWLDDNKEND